MPGFLQAQDKTHFITPATQPNDGRIQLGTLWSQTSTNELFICIGVGPVVFQLLTGGSGAPTGSAYVTIGSDGTLTAERALTAGSGITITDNGANSTVVIAASGAAAATSWLRPFAQAS